MLLSAARGERNALLGAVRQLTNSEGAIPEESKRRLARIEKLFGESKVVSLPADAAGVA
jgi:hypothetical protein